MRILSLIVVSGCLLHAGIANSQALLEPTPVRPHVLPDSAWDTALVQVRLTQDRCYAWETPQVTRSGDTFAVTQAVAPLAQCQTTGPGIGYIQLGRIGAGAYRLTYVATMPGASVFPPHVIDFVVQSRGEPGFPSVRLDPAQPTALEPVTAVVSLNTCNTVAGFRMRNDALEILVSGDGSTGWCDVDHDYPVAIGSFPPGNYTLRVVHTSEFVMATKAFSVGPARAPTRQGTEFAEELSGVWVSPDEEPGTAIVFINSVNPQPDGRRFNGLTGVWYRYDAAGRPVWYYMELTGSGSMSPNFEGFLYRYSATNPDAPAFQRSVAGTQLGAVRLQRDWSDGDLRLRGTIEGETIDIAFRQFRWTRNAWSGGN